MAEKDQVMELVKKELEKNPEIEVKKLFEEVKKKDPSVGELTLRQFNARYPLQIKRRQSLPGQKDRPRQATRRRRRRRADANREAVRETFLRFASELTAAEERKDLVRVLAKVDGYVDEVVKAVRR